MNNKEKLISRKLPPQQSARMVDGLSTKVLNPCLKKNMDFGVLKKQVFNELRLRVKYRVTAFGEKFLKLINQLEALQSELEGDQSL